MEHFSVSMLQNGVYRLQSFGTCYYTHELEHDLISGSPLGSITYLVT